MSDKRYYRVVDNAQAAPTDDYLEHGYEERGDFVAAVQRIVSRWHGRVGECIGTRHGFLLLRFADTPDGWPEDEWFPAYLVERAAPPKRAQGDDGHYPIDELYGF